MIGAGIIMQQCVALFGSPIRVIKEGHVIKIGDPRFPGQFQQIHVALRFFYLYTDQLIK